MKSMDALGLTPAQQGRAKKKFQADVRAEAAMARAERAEKAGLLLDGLADAETLATYTGDPAEMAAIGNGLLALGDRRGRTVLRKAEFYRESKALINESENIPLAELAASIQAERGKLSAASSGEAVDPDSLRHSALALKVRESIFARRAEHLKKDPAGAVSDRAGKLAEGMTPVDIVTARLRLQATDGITSPLRKVLTTAEAESLSNQWRAGGEQERLALYNQIQAQYGPYAGRVMGEMGMNPLEQSLARTALARGTPDAAQALARISAAASMADKDLPEVPALPTLKKEIVAESARLSAQRDIMARVMPGNSSFVGAVKKSEEAVERLLRVTNGNKEAVIGLLDSGVDKLEGTNFALVYEKNEVDGGTLEDALFAAARDVGTFGEAVPGYAEGQKKAERAKWLERNGIWVNAPDADGFVLCDPRSQSPIVNGRGEYFRVRAKDAAALAAASAKDIEYLGAD